MKILKERIFLSVEITAAELNGIDWFKRTFLKNHPDITPDEVAAKILRVVLSYPDKLSLLVSAIVRYSKAEDLKDEFLMRGLISSQKKYRKKKMVKGGQ